VKQLQLELLTSKASRPPYVVTRPLRDHRSCNRLMSRLHYVRRYFPELDGETIKVGLTKSASGMAVPGSNELWLNPTHITYHTIAHELVHLLQGREAGVPQGERSCDVFSLARHWTLNDVCPSYVKVPHTLMDTRGVLSEEAARLVFDVASEAVRRRHNGMRNYITFFETRLDELSPPLSHRTTA
jgi:hypothetical protein